MTSGSAFNQAKSMTQGYLNSFVGMNIYDAKVRIDRDLNLPTNFIGVNEPIPAVATNAIFLIHENNVVKAATPGDPSKIVG